MRSKIVCTLIAGGIQCSSRGSNAFTASTVADHVGIRLLVDADHDARLRLYQPASRALITLSRHLGDIAQQHGCAIAPGHYDVRGTPAP